MISAGIIGYKNHSKKIITLLKKKVEIKYIFHPRKEIKIKNFTNNIDDLLNTDCIFVLCPSQYHFFYINYFIKKRFKGYIFCEKLPVTKVSDLKKLSKIVNNKCYFNYNLRHSILNDYF